ncbi:MAG: HU family DNA-binding protein [Muribaculaceae bacterium]|nr:HU family DNA-binding protein [Muribaculaceae bacterium]
MNAEQNPTISLPQLIQSLSELSGIDAVASRKFLHEFFLLIEDTLVQGQSVRIKGIGTFSVADRTNGSVDFIPDPELAAAINTPFAMFEPILLGDDFAAEDLEPEEAENLDLEEDVATATETSTSDTSDATEPESEADFMLHIDDSDIDKASTSDTLRQDYPADDNCVAENENVPESPEDNVPDLPEESTPESPEENVPESPEGCAPESPEEDIPATRKNRFTGYIATALIALGAGFAIGYYCGNNAANENTCINADNTELTEKTDTPVAMPAEDNTSDTLSWTADEIPATTTKEIHDTISQSRFLATMARHYYGHMEYWVYIYKANPGLGNPERISPGTVVTIPPLESFALDNDSATMAQAWRIHEQIQREYRRR